MKKSVYGTLGRLARHKMQENRRALQATQTSAQQIAQEYRALRASIDKERLLARQNPQLRSLFENFARDIGRRQEALRRQQKTIDQKLAQLQNRMSLLFTEAKSFEIPYAHFLKNQEHARQQTEQKTLDEHSIQGHIRKTRAARETSDPPNGPP